MEGVGEGGRLWRQEPGNHNWQMGGEPSQSQAEVAGNRLRNSEIGVESTRWV